MRVPFVSRKDYITGEYTVLRVNWLKGPVNIPGVNIIKGWYDRKSYCSIFKSGHLVIPKDQIDVGTVLTTNFLSFTAYAYFSTS